MAATFSVVGYFSSSSLAQARRLASGSGIAGENVTQPLPRIFLSPSLALRTD